MRNTLMHLPKLREMVPHSEQKRQMTTKRLKTSTERRGSHALHPQTKES